MFHHLIISVSLYLDFRKDNNNEKHVGESDNTNLLSGNVLTIFIAQFYFISNCIFRVRAKVTKGMILYTIRVTVA